MAQKVTVYLERFGERFKVIRVKNSLDPRAGTRMNEKEVDGLIKRGIEVIIDVPRNR